MCPPPGSVGHGAPSQRCEHPSGVPGRGAGGSAWALGTGGRPRLVPLADGREEAADHRENPPQAPAPGATTGPPRVGTLFTEAPETWEGTAQLRVAAASAQPAGLSASLLLLPSEGPLPTPEPEPRLFPPVPSSPAPSFSLQLPAHPSPLDVKSYYQL